MENFYWLNNRGHWKITWLIPELCYSRYFHADRVKLYHGAMREFVLSSPGPGIVVVQAMFYCYLGEKWKPGCYYWKVVWDWGLNSYLVSSWVLFSGLSEVGTLRSAHIKLHSREPLLFPTQLTGNFPPCLKYVTGLGSCFFFLSSLCKTSSQGAKHLQWETNRRPDSQGCRPCPRLGNAMKYTRLPHTKLALAGKGRACFYSENAMKSGTLRARGLYEFFN